VSEEREQEEKATCQATTVEGRQCRATPRIGRPYCYFHDPQVAQERTGARREGGLATKAVLRPVPLKVELGSAEACIRTLEEIGALVSEGKLDARRSNALGYLAAQALGAHKMALLEGRIERLESLLSEVKAREA